MSDGNTSFEFSNQPADGDLDDDARQVVLVKHGQRYVFRYTPGQETKLIQGLVEMAGDPQSQLDWFDAAVLSHQMGQRLSKQLENILKP